MRAGRIILGVLMVVAGVLHFVYTNLYIQTMPSYLPSPLLLVQISGVAEILGGVGLLLSWTRRAAAWGLIALFLAVWPANINMALHHAASQPAWALWLRVPLQLPLIWWAWLYTRR